MGLLTLVLSVVVLPTIAAIKGGRDYAAQLSLVHLCFSVSIWLLFLKVDRRNISSGINLGGSFLRRTLDFRAMEESFQRVNASLYELYKPAETPTMQVLFFHGLSSEDLSSAHFLTWKTEDGSCIWPQTWLAEKFPRAHILTVSYGELAGEVDMYIVGENLVSDLMQEDIGQDCPVILVGHCIGGLVIKEICCHAHQKFHSNKPSKREKEQLERFLKNVKGILYYSTPHQGSSDLIAEAIDAPLFKYFKSLYNERTRLNSKFEDLQMSQKCQIYALGESLPTSSKLFNFSNAVVVPEGSSRYGYHFNIVAADHDSICRPCNKADRRFDHLTQLIRAVTILEKATQVHEEKPGVQELGAWNLASLARCTYNSIRCRVANLGGTLVGMVKQLSAHNRPLTHENLACLFDDPADCTDNSIGCRVATQDLELVDLVEMLLVHESPDMQAKAAGSLGNLAASDDSLKQQIVNQEGALAGLIRCLAANEYPGMQETGARALGNLAGGTDNSIGCRVANQDGALVGLVRLLYVHDRPSVQEQAAGALGNLAASDDSLMQQIVNQEGAVAGLVQCLAANEYPSVQENGARALANLADCTDNSIKRRVANQDGALVGLLKLLLVHERPDTQQQAARALRYLACGTDNSIGCRVANQDGALVGLVRLLYVHDRPSVQEEAAGALGNLAASDDSLMQQIVNQEGALAGLVQCLAANEYPSVQENGARALANLADCTNNSIKHRVANQVGALVGLVKLLLVHERPDTQQHAARALHNLAFNNDSLKQQIINQEGALAGLIQCLATNEHPGVQEWAAHALDILAMSEEARTLLQETDGLLKGLTCLLEAGIPPDAQFCGAQALTLINFTLGKQASLTTAKAYLGRAQALNYLKMHVEALADIEKALELQNGANPSAFSSRSFTRTKIGDLTGALEDANQAVKCSDSSTSSFSLQERGILKRIMGDLEGALADLNEGLKLETDDYEQLKHRGFVKFLLKDEEGARVDVEWAMRIKPSRVGQDDYERGQYLGVIPVEYLGYKLK